MAKPSTSTTRPDPGPARIIAVVGGPTRELRHIHRLEQLADVTASAEVKLLTAEDLDRIIPTGVHVKTFTNGELAEAYAEKINTAVLRRRAQILRKDAKTSAARRRYLELHPERRIPLEARRIEGLKRARLEARKAEARREQLLAARREEARLAEDLDLVDAHAKRDQEPAREPPKEPTEP